MSDYVLYGSKISLFTGKVRSYLRYKGIPFSEVTSSLKVYKSIIIPKTGVRFIPVVKTPNNKYIQDTAIIIEELESQFPERSVFPSTPKQSLISRLFELYADEWLLIPAMHYRWNMNQEDYIYKSFGNTILPNWPQFIQKYMGKKVGQKFRGFVPLLGINEESIPAIETWYEGSFLPLLNEHFTHHDYLLGGRASIGDFGLMGPLYAHLYLDPEPRKIMESIAPNVIKWIHRMNSTPEVTGDWLPNDGIPETLDNILSHIFQDFYPILVNTIDELKKWKYNHPAEDIPRTIGKQEFAVEGVKTTGVVKPFQQWKVQRIINSLPQDADSKQLLKECLTRYGGEALLDLSISEPLIRKNNILVWE